jgi:hypothetical protein
VSVGAGLGQAWGMQTDPPADATAPEQAEVVQGGPPARDGGESVEERSSGLSPDLQEELARLALPFADGTPSESELRVAQASLVGWLEGLFHGIQATLFAQQMAARAQLEDIRQRGLPPGAPGGPQGDPAARPGTYL